MNRKHVQQRTIDRSVWSADRKTVEPAIEKKQQPPIQIIKVTEEFKDIIVGDNVPTPIPPIEPEEPIAVEKPAEEESYVPIYPVLGEPEVPAVHEDQPKETINE